MQLEDYLTRDDRVVLPLGSTEQHGYLSLETDNILSERVAAEAAEPVGVPVLPVLPYGLTPSFAAFPGSPTLRVQTYVSVVRDLLDSLFGQGFRRVLIVNGHGGNPPARSAVQEWASTHDGAQAIWHDWWLGPRVQEVAGSIDPVHTHANWFENFPWTRLPGVELPTEPKERVAYGIEDPTRVRETIGDGVFGGVYARPDEDVLRVWQAGVEEVRDLLENGWR